MILPTVSRRILLQKYLGTLVVSVSLLTLVGCQQEAPQTTASPAPGSSASSEATTGNFPPKPEGEFKIGLVTPGSTKTDKAWSGLAWEGVQRIAKETGAKVTPPVEGLDAAAVAGGVRNLAQGGDQLIFLHGSEYDSAAASVAPDFPKTTFVVVGGRTEKPNLTPIKFSAGGAVYLAGMVAGGMTKTNKVACVGGSEIPIVKEAFANFAEGAKAVNPKVEVRVVFTGDEKDIAKAKQQTEALLADGFDVIQHNANDAGRGVAQAVEGKSGTFFMGANADQSELATKQNLGSFILDVPAAYLAVGKRVAAGEGDGKPVSAGLAEHAVYFKFNDKVATPVPAELKAKVAQAEKDIIAGKIAIQK